MPDLAKLADKINAAFEHVDTGRIDAGRLLLEARKLVGPYGWRKWCEIWITTRSFRDCQRCCALARSDDPVGALKLEREKTRVAVQKHREQHVFRKTLEWNHPGEDTIKYVTRLLGVLLDRESTKAQAYAAADVLRKTISTIDPAVLVPMLAATPAKKVAP